MCAARWARGANAEQTAGHLHIYHGATILKKTGGYTRIATGGVWLRCVRAHVGAYAFVLATIG